ncbi:unnamed protein product [Dovyalis caffra]|uniref:FAD-binding domain-containing protein n=1 Tax=Dovyalis caffra TaxID=77055 RepID=A0AAV1RET9_9ROSI|nr:unnamed protein product [Dovyalis caffra]
MGSSSVTGVEKDQWSGKVTVILEDGQHYDGDVLAGADGICNTVGSVKTIRAGRCKLFGLYMLQWPGKLFPTLYIHYQPVAQATLRILQEANLSLARLHTYNEMISLTYAQPVAPTGILKSSNTSGKKKRQLNLFGNWCKEVIELISETPEDTILRRDICDRDMIYNWGIGWATLLGNAAHAMQPNLGQGGCMAIESRLTNPEDCYQLILELDKFAKGGLNFQQSNEIATALRRCEKKRMFRVSKVMQMPGWQQKRSPSTNPA